MEEPLFFKFNGRPTCSMLRNPILSIIKTFVSRMRSKGSRFTLGFWGLRVCSLDILRICSQPSATVRNRPQPFACGRMAVPMVSSAKGITFGCLRRVAAFRVAGMALCDIQTCFVTCRQSFCVAGAAIPLQRFRKMSCSFRGGRSTVDVSIVILRRSVVCFFANRIVRAASSGDKVQIPWQVWNFVRCDEKWRKSLARNIDLVVANLEGHKKTRRNTSILKLQSVKNGGSLARNARFDAPTCLVSSLVFLRPRRVYGGSCKTSPFRRFPSRLSCRFAWQARHFVTVQPAW